MPHDRLVKRQQTFGYTYEELNLLVAPMVRSGAEPIGSMGTDTPVAVLSQRPRMLYDYFQQLFAQVTNPPLDAIREEVVTSLQGTTGGERDLLTPTELSCHQIALPQPILRNRELAKLINLNPDDEVNGRPHGMRSKVIRCLYPVAEGGAGLAAALEDVRAQASAAIADGARVIILSDRESDERMAPIPSLLAVAGCTTTWCATGHAPTWVWWWRPVTPARCTTWRRWSASAPRRSTRTWRSSRSRTCSTGA